MILTSPPSLQRLHRLTLDPWFYSPLTALSAGPPTPFLPRPISAQGAPAETPKREKGRVFRTVSWDEREVVGVAKHECSHS